MLEAPVAGGAEGRSPDIPTQAARAARRILCVVANFNRKDALLRCLDRILHRVVVPPGYRLDVLVVDNNSTDGSRSALTARFPGVAVVNTGSNLGGSGAFRLGLRHAMKHRYDLVWLHDNDAFSSRHVLRHYLSTLERFGGEALVGGSMHQLEAPRLLNEVGGFFGRDRSIDIHLPLQGLRSTRAFRRDDRRIEADFLAFANMLMPVEVVRRIGLPEDFFLHYDDIEFCLRARAAGYPVVAVPAAVFWHESWHAKPTTWIQYYNTRNSLWTVALRLPDKLRRRRLLWMLSAAMNIVSGRLALAGAILDGLRDQAHGVMGRVEVPIAGFAVHDLIEGGIEPLLAAYGCRHLAVDYQSLQTLPRSYQAPWLACLKTLGDRGFLCRLVSGRFTLHPGTASITTQWEGEDTLAAPLDPDEARRIAANTLLVRSSLYTGPRARLVLSAFRRLLWLHGTHVVDHNADAGGRDLLRLLARWLSSWVYLTPRREGTSWRGDGA